MARLYGRVRRLSHRGLILALALGAGAANAQPAPAAPSEDESVGRSAREIDAMLGRLTDGSPAQRRAAADEVIASIERDDVPAVRQRLLAPWRFDPMQLRLKVIRAIRVATGGRENAPYDLLTVMLAAPRAPDTDRYVERIVLARGLARIPSADAGRALIALAAAYDGVLRQEVGRLVRAQVKDYALPAIIELRAPSEAMRIFIRQTREAIRRVTPGDTVQQRDNALLAEILRAYGSVRQADAMRVVVSFVNNERAQVRDAARQATAAYGALALNALRDAYEMYEGQDPPAAWGWERVARELYEANDRRREAEVARRMDQGLAASRAGNHEEALGHFRFVLARMPSFARRTEMVDALIAHARALESRDAARAVEVWRLALWVHPDGPHAREIRGAILFIEAERALQRGVGDPELYRAVLRVDPTNARARAQLESVSQEEVAKARTRRKRLGVAALFAVAMGVLYGMLKKPARRARPLPPPPPAPPPPPPPAGDADATIPGA